jgi:hypothetical protein
MLRIVLRSSSVRIVLASLAAAGLVGTLAMLAVAAPSQHSATAAEYCLAGDKQQRKADLSAANKAVSRAQVAVAKSNTALKNTTKHKVSAKKRAVAKKALARARARLVAARQNQHGAQAAFNECA